jgi:two-component system, cell cycle response regulator
MTTEATEGGSIRLLVVDDNLGDRRLIRRQLAEARASAYLIEEEETLNGALQRLGRGGVDAVLLDLDLPDSQGLDTFLKTRAKAEKAAIVILASPANEGLSMIAVREGAQDYVVKGEADAACFSRAVAHALLRLELQGESRLLILLDGLTSLYNQRGFLMLAQQHCKLARRAGRPFQMVYVDLDGLKTINDASGYQAGDAALRRTADVLRQTFRDSDIIARVGGDEFAVLMADAETGNENLTSRLLEGLAIHNRENGAGRELSLSVGVTTFDPQNPVTLEQLLEAASQAMVAHKQAQGKTQ